MRTLRHVLALPLLLLTSLSCRSRPETAATPPASADPTVVELSAEQAAHAGLSSTKIELRESAGTLRLPGTLEVDPRRSWRVAPVVDGVVEEVEVATHESLRKGQVLARLRSAALGEAQVSWLEARAALRIATANHERNLGLHRQAVISEGRWLEVEADLERAQVAMAQADHRLALAGMSSQQVAALESEGRRFGEMTLTSPANGVVLATTAARGQALAGGENAFEIADLSKLWVTVHIPVASLAQVRPGAPATVHVAGSPVAGWQGTIDSLGGRADAADQTVEGRIVVDNPGGFLRPGMYAQVEVAGVPVQALMVPSGALFNVGNQAHVFQKLADSRFKALAVTAGAPLGAWTPVSGPDIAVGVEVVVDGVAELKSHWLYAGGE